MELHRDLINGIADEVVAWTDAVIEMNDLDVTEETYEAILELRGTNTCCGILLLMTDDMLTINCKTYTCEVPLKDANMYESLQDVIYGYCVRSILERYKVLYTVDGNERFSDVYTMNKEFKKLKELA